MLGVAVLALGLPSYQEMLVLLVVGVLIFGRRLPEVGYTLGKTIAQIRRGLVDFKAQIAADEDLRSAKSAAHDLKRAIEAPRVLANPRRFLDQIVDAEATPKTEAKPAAPPESPPATPAADQPGTAPVG